MTPVPPQVLALSDPEREALDFLRIYASTGFPKRVDGSWDPDFLTAVRRLCLVPDSVSSRTLENALQAGPDLDYRLGRYCRPWEWTREYLEAAGVG